MNCLLFTVHLLTMNILTPPIAFLLYLFLVAVLSGLGRMLAGAVTTTGVKTETYGSGE